MHGFLEVSVGSPRVPFHFETVPDLGLPRYPSRPVKRHVANLAATYGNVVLPPGISSPKAPKWKSLDAFHCGTCRFGVCLRTLSDRNVPEHVQPNRDPKS